MANTGVFFLYVGCEMQLNEEMLSGIISGDYKFVNFSHAISQLQKSKNVLKKS